MGKKTFFIRKWCVGDLNALLKKIGEENARGILDGTREITITPKPIFLGPQTKITLPAIANPHNPQKFFKTRKGLGVFITFTTHVLPVAKRVGALPSKEIAYFPTLKQAYDTEIQSELPEGYVFEDTSVFCAYIADMIDQQPNGEEGTLLTDGSANICYIKGINEEVLSGGVFRRIDTKDWVVIVGKLNGISSWRVGSRVLSATAVA